MNIAILGCGTVASGVVQLLKNNSEEIRKSLGEEIVIRRILARTPSKAEALGFTADEICSTMDEVLADESIALVAELMGGTTVAYECICRAMKSGRHVVTANKDVIALYSEELDQLSAENNVALFYEASVGGGIPLIGPLRQTLAANKIKTVYGILNGTTNYILTRMTKDGSSYQDALKGAQELGYAEADPTSDVKGADAARKIAILSSLAFHSRVTYPQVHHEGITNVTQTDIRFAKQQGYVPKLLAVTKEEEDGVSVYVRPALVPESHPLAAVNEAFNALYLIGDPVGKVMLYGQGAGGGPTASSVVGDIMEAGRLIRQGDTVVGQSTCYANKPLKDISRTDNVYYVRLLVADKARVLAGVASAFGDHNVSIASFVQEPRSVGRAELMILTHAASEADMQGTIYDLMQRDYVHEVHTMICLEEEA